MRVIKERVLTGIDTKLVFSAAERKTLAAAAAIAEEARRQCRTVVGEVEFEQTDDDTDLAHAEHACRWMAEDGCVVLDETYDPLAGLSL